MMISPILLIIVLFIFLKTSIKVLKENEMIVVLRLGHVHRVVGPGPRTVFYPADWAVRVNLDDKLPGWNVLSPDELISKVSDLVLGKSPY